MTDGSLIRQAYRFALEVHPEQEHLLLNFTGATRFFFNWGLGLVTERLDQRADGQDVTVPWSYKTLCSEFSKVKDRVAPWRAEVVCGSQQAGLEQLGRALQAFSRARKAGRHAGFPRFRAKGRSKEVVIFQHPRILDVRYVHLDRRLGPLRTRERMRKLIRLLETDPYARVLRSTVSRHNSRWFISFTVERSPKRRCPRRSQAVVGVDLGLRHFATLSTGEHIPNARPLLTVLRRLRRCHRQLDRQRRAANPNNYDAWGRVIPGPKEWRSSGRMRRTHRHVQRLHERAANLRREHAHRVTTELTREFGVIGVESLHVRGLLANQRLARHISDASWGRLLRQLAYKTSWSGSVLVSADRFYPSSRTCSTCGSVKAKLGPKERIFTCDTCGLVLDRDLNAALNLAALAEQQMQADGLGQIYVARTGRETLSARGGQVSPAGHGGFSPRKREGSLESAQRREALALANRDGLCSRQSERG